MTDSPESQVTPPAKPTPPAPAAGGQTPPAPVTEEPVTLSKKDHDELQRKAAQASEAQSRADKLERESKRSAKRKVAEQPTPFEQQELAEVKSKVTTAILLNPKYQELANGNSILAKVLAQNPLQLLDTTEFVDVQDAVDEVMGYLDDQVAAATGKPTPTPTATLPADSTPPAPAAATPPASATPTKTEQEREDERLAKLPAMERVQQKIRGKIDIR